MISSQLILTMAANFAPAQKTPQFALLLRGDLWQAYVWLGNDGPALVTGNAQSEAGVRSLIFESLLSLLLKKQEEAFNKNDSIQDYEKRRSLIALARKRGKL